MEIWLLYKTQNICETSLWPLLIEGTFSNIGSISMPILEYLYSCTAQWIIWEKYLHLKFERLTYQNMGYLKFECSYLLWVWWLHDDIANHLGPGGYSCHLLIILCSWFSKLGTAICPRINRNEEIMVKYSGFYPLHKGHLLEKTYRGIASEI